MRSRRTDHFGKEIGAGHTPTTWRPEEDRENERATLSIPEAAKLIGISRNAAYAAARAGALPVWRIGTRILVLRRPLEAMLAGEGPAGGD